MSSPEVLSSIEDRSEPKSETETSVKDDPEVVAISERVVKKRSNNSQQNGRVKAEKPDEENATIDLTLLPEAPYAEDMFDDVDGAEVVDLTYEGIAEIDGVDHFVCEGQLPDSWVRQPYWQSLRFQDSADTQASNCY